MLTAKEARELAAKCTKIRDILVSIGIQATIGLGRIYVPVLSDTQIIELETLGYFVEPHELGYCISWDRAF